MLTPKELFWLSICVLMIAAIMLVYSLFGLT